MLFKMNIQLEVKVTDRFNSYYGVLVVVPDDVHYQCFVPLRECTEVYLAEATAEVTQAEAKIIRVIRKDAADILARQLSELIVAAMEKDDTLNGYKVK